MNKREGGGRDERNGTAGVGSYFEFFQSHKNRILKITIFYQSRVNGFLKCRGKFKLAWESSVSGSP